MKKVTKSKSVPKKSEPSLAVQKLLGASEAKSAQSTAAATLATRSDAVDMSQFDVVSRSPLIKPDKMVPGQTYIGVFKKLITCVAGKNEDGSNKPGNLIELVPQGGKVGIAIPATATLCGALDIVGKGDEAESPHLGKVIAIEVLPDRIPSKKGQAAWNFLVAIKRG